MHLAQTCVFLCVCVCVYGENNVFEVPTQEVQI